VLRKLESEMLKRYFFPADTRAAPPFDLDDWIQRVLIQDDGTFLLREWFGDDIVQALCDGQTQQVIVQARNGIGRNSGTTDVCLRILPIENDQSATHAALLRFSGRSKCQFHLLPTCVVRARSHDTKPPFLAIIWRVAADEPDDEVSLLSASSGDDHVKRGVLSLKRVPRYTFQLAVAGARMRLDGLRGCMFHPAAVVVAHSAAKEDAVVDSLTTEVRYDPLLLTATWECGGGATWDPVHALNVPVVVVPDAAGNGNLRVAPNAAFDPTHWRRRADAALGVNDKQATLLQSLASAVWIAPEWRLLPAPADSDAHQHDSSDVYTLGLTLLDMMSFLMQSDNATGPGEAISAANFLAFLLAEHNGSDATICDAHRRFAAAIALMVHEAPEDRAPFEFVLRILERRHVSAAICQDLTAVHTGAFASTSSNYTQELIAASADAAGPLTAASSMDTLVASLTQYKQYRDFQKKTQDTVVDEHAMSDDRKSGSECNVFHPLDALPAWRENTRAVLPSPVSRLLHTRFVHASAAYDELRERMIRDSPEELDGSVLHADGGALVGCALATLLRGRAVTELHITRFAFRHHLAGNRNSVLRAPTPRDLVTMRLALFSWERPDAVPFTGHGSSQCWLHSLAMAQRLLTAFADNPDATEGFFAPERFVFAGAHWATSDAVRLSETDGRYFEGYGTAELRNTPPERRSCALLVVEHARAALERGEKPGYLRFDWMDELWNADMMVTPDRDTTESVNSARMWDCAFPPPREDGDAGLDGASQLSEDAVTTPRYLASKELSLVSTPSAEAVDPERDAPPMSQRLRLGSRQSSRAHQRVRSRSPLSSRLFGAKSSLSAEGFEPAFCKSPDAAAGTAALGPVPGGLDAPNSATARGPAASEAVGAVSAPTVVTINDRPTVSVAPATLLNVNAAKVANCMPRVFIVGMLADRTGRDHSSGHSYVGVTCEGYFPPGRMLVIESHLEAPAAVEFIGLEQFVRRRGEIMEVRADFGGLRAAQRNLADKIENWCDTLRRD